MWDSFRPNYGIRWGLYILFTFIGSFITTRIARLASVLAETIDELFYSKLSLHHKWQFIWKLDARLLVCCNSWILQGFLIIALAENRLATPIARFMGTTRDPSGADRTQVGPMLAPWTLLSGHLWLSAATIDKSPLDITTHAFIYCIYSRKDANEIHSDWIVLWTVKPE